MDSFCDIFERVISYLKHLLLHSRWAEEGPCLSQDVRIAQGLKDELAGLRDAMREKITSLTELLIVTVKDHRWIHPGLLSGLLLRRSLQTKLGLIWVGVACRYQGGTHVWCCLLRLLLPALGDLRTQLQRLDKDIWKISTRLPLTPLLDNFLNRYGEEFEVHFVSSELEIPWELRLTQLLLVCPPAVGGLELVSLSSGVCHLWTGFSHTPRELPLPKVNETQSREINEREIIYYIINIICQGTNSYISGLLDYIRNSGTEDLTSSPYFQDILHFLRSGDESIIKYSRETYGPKDTQDTFNTESTYEMIKYALYCSYNFSSTTSNMSYLLGRSTKNILKTFEVLGSSKMTNFTLGIRGENKNSYLWEEILVTYESDLDNYKITTREHSIA